MNYKPKTEKLVVMAASTVVDAVDQVATRKFWSRSQYVRQAVLEALAKDGVQPVIILPSTVERITDQAA